MGVRGGGGFNGGRGEGASMGVGLKGIPFCQ